MLSMTPDHYKKVGIGVAPSPMPFFTPRPERHWNDPREMGRRSICQDKDGEVNVQVILRCRPLVDDEERVNKVITCNEQRREVVVLQSIANKQVDKVFTFDKVFGPKTQQRSIYDQAISPLVSEVLDGYSCTVFAYGQTGTGKTYTMEGEMRSTGGDLPAEAGVIPRAVRQIVDTLEAQNADYSMKATFMELYNEEINDLLAPEDKSRFMDDKQKKSVSLMEDGKGCVVIRGLQEEVVCSANDIYNLLDQGAAKRRTADTLLNKRSSRSHAIFTITVHVREANIGDGDLIKCGKLNLVDLAGSENISRSGSREVRAKEAGEINKSLLTLGRVINALVERSSHIPYRDSKLTRLLRDSLGGRMKTCIIATISPSALCLEETLSTLDYAYRAKRIKNRPMANQKLSKAVLLKELYMEIERMKQDVRAAREKNGIYVPHERFAKEEAEKKANNERIEQLEIDLNLAIKEVDKYRELYLSEQANKLEMERQFTECKISLGSTKKALIDLQENHRQAVAHLKEKDLSISNLLSSENSLIERAKELRSQLEIAAEDIVEMHKKIGQQNKLEAQNHELVLTFGSELDLNLKKLHKSILASVSKQQNQLRCMEEQTCSFLSRKDEAMKHLESKFKEMMKSYESGRISLTELTHTLQKKASMDFEQINSTMLSQISSVEKFLESAQAEAKEVISGIWDSLCSQKQLMAFSFQKQQEGMERDLLSSKLITEEANEFFDDLYDHASKLIMSLKKSQNRCNCQLEDFEKKFKEQSAKEEKQAAEKIATILTTLTASKTAMVSEALKAIRDSRTQEVEMLGQKLSGMQQISIQGEMAISGHIEQVERNVLGESYLLTHTNAIMEDHIKKCLGRLDFSRHLQEKTSEMMDNLNSSGTAEIQSMIRKMIDDKENQYENYVSTSNSKDVEFDTCALSLLAVVKDSFAMDHEVKEKVDSLSVMCLNELHSKKNKHKEIISSIKNRAQSCLAKEYLVDQLGVPENPVITIPTMESIEKMRTPCFDELSRNVDYLNNTNWVKVQRPLPQKVAASPDRAPFAAAN